MAKNQVISGVYAGKKVSVSAGTAFISMATPNSLTDIQLTPDNVASYELIDADRKKSATSAVSRAAVGGLLLGPVGLLAGVSAKKKGDYLISIQFKNGAKSLIEVDEKRYKAIITKNF